MKHGHWQCSIAVQTLHLKAFVIGDGSLKNCQKLVTFQQIICYVLKTV